MPNHSPSRYPQIRLAPVQNCGENRAAPCSADLVVTVLKLHGDEECAVAAVGGLCLGMIERASATDWMIIPDFQPKLGVQGCRVKVRGGLGREPPAGVLAQCGGLEPALRTGRMATSHKPPQPCTSLWTRPVDNSATT